jgi:hypothetical protein
MPSASTPLEENRSQPRLALAPMYTFVRVRPEGRQRFCWTGHIYDISETGMRFEVDRPIEPGTRLDIQATLPGAPRIDVHATGHVVRLHDDANDPGPIRMGMVFETFSRQADRLRLSDYLETELKAA